MKKNTPVKIQARAIRFNAVLGVRIVEEKVDPKLAPYLGRDVAYWPDHVGYWHFTTFTA